MFFLTQQTLVQLPRIGEGPGIDSQGSVEQSTVVTGFKERKSFICAELIFAKYIIINHINNLFEKKIYLFSKIPRVSYFRPGTLKLLALLNLQLN